MGPASDVWAEVEGKALCGFAFPIPNSSPDIVGNKQLGIYISPYTAGLLLPLLLVSLFWPDSGRF